MTVTVHLPTDEAAWLELRDQDVTASVAAALLGIHHYETPYSLWAAKTGRLPPKAETRAMRRGKLFESVAVKLIAEERPDWLLDYRDDRAYYRDEAARIGATPDLFAERPDYAGRGIVQIKTSSHDAFRKNWRDPDTNDVVPPLWIAVQTIIEAKLTGSTWASVAVMDCDTLDMHIVDVPIHQSVWQRVVRKVDEFWTLIASGEEPDPDWGCDGRVILSVYGESEPDRVPLVEVAGLDGLIARYQRATEARREADQVRDLLKPQIIFALGNAEAGFTENFDISAPTTRKEEAVVRASSWRSLRIRSRKEMQHG